MKKKIALLLSGIVVLAALVGCTKTQANGHSFPEESVVTVQTQEIVLKGNDSLNALAQFYAGMPVEDSVSAFGKKLRNYQKTGSWKSYARQMDALWRPCMERSQKIDSIGANEMADIREHCTNVLYTFGAADFVFPTSFFPTADNYYLVGLEKPGTVLSERKIGQETYNAFLSTFNYILRHSYFITKDMMTDLNNQYIDGTIPVLMVMMARMDRQIVKVLYKTLQPDGTMADSPTKGKICEIQYFKRGSGHLQHFYFISGNLSDKQKDENFLAFFNQLDYEHTVAYLKAASFLMHCGDKPGAGFTTVRSNNLKAWAVVEEDSGIPYRYFNNDNWDITLYGAYVHPLQVFSEYCYQKDLKQAYDNCKDVHPLNFRLGYDRVSNLLVARKRQSNQ